MIVYTSFPIDGPNDAKGIENAVLRMKKCDQELKKRGVAEVFFSSKHYRKTRFRDYMGSDHNLYDKLAFEEYERQTGSKVCVNVTETSLEVNPYHLKSDLEHPTSLGKSLYVCNWMKAFYRYDGKSAQSSIDAMFTSELGKAKTTFDGIRIKLVTPANPQSIKVGDNVTFDITTNHDRDAKVEIRILGFLEASVGLFVYGDPMSTGIDAGFAVHLDCGDGAVTSELHNDGRMLVQGLALGEGDAGLARTTILGRTVYGLVTVESPRSWHTLPYADNAANLIYTDNLQGLTQLGLPLNEIRRTLFPLGVALVGQKGGIDPGVLDGLMKGAGMAEYRVINQDGGTFALYKKALSSDMDGWTHYNYGPEGNAVSKDKALRPPSHIKWVDSNVDGAKSSGLAGFRASNGRVLYNYRDEGTGKGNYCGRDAFNGTLLWEKQHNLGSARLQSHITSSGDGLYAVIDKAGPVVAIDGKSGEIVKSYDKTKWGNPGKIGDNNPADWVEIVYCEGTLLHTAINKVHALDPESGDVLWTYDAGSNGFPIALIASKSANKAFFIVAGSPVRAQNRWLVGRGVVHIACVELSSGTVLWEDTRYKGRAVGQLIYYDGKLGIFCFAAISGGTAEEGLAALIQVSDRKLLRERKTESTWNKAAYNAFVKYGRMYYPGAYN